MTRLLAISGVFGLVLATVLISLDLMRLDTGLAIQEALSDQAVMDWLNHEMWRES